MAKLTNRKINAFVLSLVLCLGLLVGAPSAAQADKLAHSGLSQSKDFGSQALRLVAQAVVEAPEVVEAIDAKAVEAKAAELEKTAEATAKAEAKAAKKAAKAEAKKAKEAAKAEAKKIKEATKAESKKVKEEAKKLKEAAKAEAKAKNPVDAGVDKATDM